jgi:hypothetical protein
MKIKVLGLFTTIALLVLQGCAAPTASMQKVQGDPTGTLYVLNTDSGVDIHGGPVNKATAVARITRDNQVELKPIVDGSSVGMMQSTLPALIAGGAQVGSAGIYGSYQKAAMIGSARELASGGRDVARINQQTALELQKNQKPSGPGLVLVNQVEGSKAFSNAETDTNVGIGIKTNTDTGAGCGNGCGSGGYFDDHGGNHKD